MSYVTLGMYFIIASACFTTTLPLIFSNREKKLNKKASEKVEVQIFDRFQREILENKVYFLEIMFEQTLTRLIINF